MSKILFIYEGAKKEKKFCKFIIDRYFDVDKNEKDFFAYKANIYSLYDELTKDYGLDTVELVRGIARKNGDRDSYDKLTNNNFTEIYLIFDFDPQASQYNKNKLLEMVNYFDNETENGKLYINYPMMESFNHFITIPDLNYNSYKVSVDECQKYKRYIDKVSKVKYFGSISESVLDVIVAQNIDKYEYISKKNINTYDLYLGCFSQEKLLKLQILNMEKSNDIYVFNTSVFWGIDYYGIKIYDKYITLKNDLYK